MPRRATLLLIEDSEDDSALFKRALTSASVPVELRIVGSCSQAREYLLGAGEFTDRTAFPFPQLIISDNCRETFGTAELLRWLRTKPECQVIPVIVMTGSASPAIVRSSYDLGVHSVFEKPARNTDLQALLQLLVAYWSKALVPALAADEK